MPEIFRTRDMVLFFKDDTTPVVVSDNMVQQGWPGGQGVMYVESSVDEFLVDFSDGRFGGFLLWGSDEEGDDFTAMTRNQLTYEFGTFLSGATLFATSTFEKFTLASRLTPPLVPLTYVANDPLFLSNRGFWTNEDEATILALPHAPNEISGFVSQVPKSLNNFYLGIQTTM